MISDRYLCSDNEATSLRKVAVDVAVIPVRSRLIKAVFFLSEESRLLLTAKTSMENGAVSASGV